MKATSIPRQPDGGASAKDTTELRAHVQGMWAAVAGGWGEHAEFVAARGASDGNKMLALTQPQPGERVLELACGPGSLGLAAAPLVSPGGEVVMSDVVKEMTEFTATRAAAAGLDNVSTRVLDLEDIAEPDESFDVVLCREGLMLTPDPARAAAEIRRVLTPGGRVAITVWGPRARNPWLGVVLDTAAAQLGRPVPPPGMPGPFALDDADRLQAILSGAGLADVSVEEFSVPLIAGSFDEWWMRTCALAGPLAVVLKSLPEEATTELRERAKAAVGPFETSDGLEFPGVSLVASAIRQESSRGL